eukprot:16846-Eustigmatos_ZCMA.PRE.1
MEVESQGQSIHSRSAVNRGPCAWRTECACSGEQSAIDEGQHVRRLNCLLFCCPVRKTNKHQSQEDGLPAIFPWLCGACVQRPRP